MGKVFKSYTWLIILLLLYGNSIYCQNENAIHITDLKNKLQSTKSDSSKIKILNELSDNYKYANAKIGIEYGKEALILAEKYKNKKEIANAHRNLGISYQTLKENKTALFHFQKALELFKKTSNYYDVAATLKNIALVYSSNNTYKEALYYFEKTLNLYQFLNDKTQIVYCLNDIANLYYTNNNYIKAIEYYNQSIKINQELKDKNGLAYCLKSLGEIQLKEKKYSKAAYYFEKAIKTYDKSQKENRNIALKELSNTYLLLAKTDTKNSDFYLNLSNKALKKIAEEKDIEFSDSVESLKKRLKTEKVDTIKIKILNTISQNYFYNNPREGLTYCKGALELSEKINYKKGIAAAHENIGVCQWVLTDYSKSLFHFYKSLKIYKEIKDEKGISSLNNNIGLLNAEMKNYTKAFYYINMSYQINKKLGNKVLMVYNLNNIANTYFQKGDTNKSLAYYNLSKEMNEKMNDFNGLAYVYTKIGTIKSYQKNYTQALEYYNLALKHFDDDQKYNRGNTTNEIGKTYFELAKQTTNQKEKHLKLSEQFILKANEVFFEIGALDKINECNFLLYKIYKEQASFKKSFVYFEKYSILKDSILFNENQNKLINIESQREIDLKDKQIEIQKLKINTNSKKVQLLATITGAIAILLVLFFWLFINKRATNLLLSNKNEEISSINKQKDKFFSIIAHDLRGPFNGFLGLTELLAEDINAMEKEEIQFAATNMRTSANNLNSLLENLLEWSRMEQGMIPFAPLEIKLLPVVSECVVTVKDAAANKGISIKTLIEDKTTVFADDPILKAVIRNILSNAVKFTPKGGTIIIQAKEDDKNTTIAIKDSGIGMDEKMIKNLFQLDVKTNRKGTEDEPSSGLGLILCKEFIEKHGGKIWVESEENIGTTFYFSFPKASQIDTF